MHEHILQYIAWLYQFNILIALFSYGNQQWILLEMIRGKRPLSCDVSLIQFWIWTSANLVTALYALLHVQTDTPLIILSFVNFINSFLTALLNSYVHYLHRKRKSP
ncbi:MAG: hypothetical protein KZQ73_03945 [Candidatus Thiodiazotropha sp. (ex Semelilucina semeliformis)]|nr:hypothetical protein [Candidatus Thiodiazotropha sp. (ex Semelilucina semeliformis)]